MTKNLSRRNCILGRSALVFTTLIWGTSFVILKTTINEVPLLYVLAYRFSGAAVLMFLIGIKDIKKLDFQYLKGGAIMGLYIFAAYVLQTYGLANTSPGKNAFLTTTYCVLVPFIYWITAKKRPDVFNFLAAFICVLGVGLVSLDGSLTANKGDLLTLGCGLFFGLHIVATTKYIEGRSVVILTMVQFATSASLCWIFALITDPVPTNISATSLWSIVYLCVMCTAVCYVLQVFGQKYTPPSSAAVIMTMESVFGAAISVIFYHEQVTIKLLAGFALIFIAVLISETKLSFLRKKHTIIG